VQSTKKQKIAAMQATGDRIKSTGPSWTLEDGSIVTIDTTDERLVTMSNGARVMMMPNLSAKQSVDTAVEYMGISVLNPK
jgi:hypothetical protein